MLLNPKEFDLPARTVLEKRDGRIFIVMDRKSRIIMADGRKILEKVRKIRRVHPSAPVGLRSTAPLCSKTRKFLEAEGIELIVDE